MTVEQREHTSPTRRALDDALVRRLAEAAVPGAEVADWAELGGGEFAAVARVALRDGRELVLKVGPRPSVPLLAYERGMVAAEVRYLTRLAREAPQVPVAALLAHGADTGGGVIGDGADGGGEWMAVSLLPGESLYRFVDAAREAGEPDPSGPVRAALGAACARVHALTSPDGAFGYDDGVRPHGHTWPEAFTAIIEALLADAAAWDLALPAAPERIRALIARNGAALAQVTRPALVHFDLWDGNVLAARSEDGTLELTGLVDGERFLYGDPLIDFVSTALFRRIESEPEHPFVAGYRAAAGQSARPFTSAELRRLALYRLHLYLLMYVEMPSRGKKRDALEHAERWDRLEAVLLGEIELLEQLPPEEP